MNTEPSVIDEPSVNEIGNAFARQYYPALHEIAKEAHKFYGHESTLLMNEHSLVVGKEKIGHLLEQLMADEKSRRIRIHKIKGMAIDGLKAIMIQVYGEIAERQFTQTFILKAQRSKSYYVLHDSFMFQDIAFHQKDSDVDV